MTHTFTAHFRIRQYELDAQDTLPNRVLAQLFQETSMRASTDAGYNVDWYALNETVWVIRAMTLEHLRPIRYPDELEITTWLAEMQRVRAFRQYLARHTATGEVVARANVYWAHLDRASLLPARIPQSIVDDLAPNGAYAVPRKQPRSFPAPARACEIHSRRHVQHYEADGLQHVNNTIYLDWLEEPLRALVAPPRRLCVRRHDIEYVRGAVPGDELEITTRLTGVGRCATTWAQEITRGDEVVVRNRMVAVCLDDAGRPTRLELPVRN